MARHRALLSVIVLSYAAFVGTVLFTAMAATSEPKGLFLSTTNSIYSKFKLEITPASWTFWMWPIILIWNGLWVIYFPFTLCKRDEVTTKSILQDTGSKTDHIEESPQQPGTQIEITTTSFQQNAGSACEHVEESAQQAEARKHMDKICCTAYVHSPIFFVLWFCLNLFHIVWLFLCDREYFFPALFLISVIPVVGCEMLAMSYKNCFEHGAWLSINSPGDTWSLRILVHNGLAAYVTWAFVACLINFGIVLKYDALVPDSRVSSSILHLLLFGLLFWFFLESLVFEEYVRYTVTIYPVAAVALFGMFLRRGIPFSNMSQTDVIIVVVLVVSLVACMLRLVLLLLCHSVRPLFPMENYKSLDISLSVLDQSCHGGTSEVTSTAIEEIHSAQS